MAEQPILFKADMVVAILDGRKTQTRRVVTPHTSVTVPHVPRKRWNELDFAAAVVDEGPSPAGNPGPYLKVPWRGERVTVRVYPRVQPGDTLWVRETLHEEITTADTDTPNGRLAVYSADGQVVQRDGRPAMYDWERETLPSIHMPRWAARITLPVTDVRAERVQDIFEADAMAEGIRRQHVDDLGQTWHTHRRGFQTIWDTINAPRGYGWDTNPWVWPITFERADNV